LKNSDNSNLCNFLSIYSWIGIVVTFLFPTSRIFSASGYPVVEWILASSALVIIPLGLKAAIQDAGPYHPSFLWKLAVYSQPIAGISLALSLFVEVGILSGILSLIWAVNSVLIFLIGLKKILLRGLYIHEETFIDIGLIYLPVGAVWYSASRWGIDLLGFSSFIVTLTAVHFHIAGMGASVMTGQLGRVVKHKNPAAYLAAGSIISSTPILVAAGINSSPIVEVIMACLLAAGVAVLAVLTIRTLPYKFSNDPSSVRKFLYATLGASQSISLLTMILACTFAYGEYREQAWIPLESMVTYHGILNYFGFLAPSLVCLGLLDTRRSNIEEYIPFQNLFGSSYIGADFFKANHLINFENGRRKGLYDDFISLFQIEALRGSANQTIIRYFEDTSNVALVCQPRWLAGFKWLSLLVHYIGRRLGQLTLPLNGEVPIINSELHSLNKRAGLTTNPVSCIRTYEDGTPMHVTSYSTHRISNRTYMNISLPIPLGQLHSILGINTIPGNSKFTGLKLSSKSQQKLDTGLWLDFKFFRIKIPLHETLEMWDSESPKEINNLGIGITQDNSSIAHHTFWFLGIKCLELNYAVIKKNSTSQRKELFTG